MKGQDQHNWDSKPVEVEIVGDLGLMGEEVVVVVEDQCLGMDP